jgi:hypothetical protein
MVVGVFYGIYREFQTENRDKEKVCEISNEYKEEGNYWRQILKRKLSINWSIYSVASLTTGTHK